MKKKKNTCNTNKGSVISLGNSGWIVATLAVVAQAVLFVVVLAKTGDKEANNSAPPDLAIFSSWLEAQGKEGMEITLRSIDDTGLWEVKVDGYSYILLNNGTRAVSGSLIDLTAVGVVDSDQQQNNALSDIPYSNGIKERIKEKISKEVSETLKENQISKESNEESVISLNGSQMRKVGYDKDGNPVSLEDKKKQTKALYNSVKDKITDFGITYKADDEKENIIVFTDYTCGYCRRLHAAIPSLNAAGVSVSYLFYPRALGAGVGSSQAQIVLENMKNAWCAEDPKEALDLLYNGKAIPAAECADKDDRINFPGIQHYLLANVLNISATPMTVLSEGKTFVGFSNIADYLNKVGI